MDRHLSSMDAPRSSRSQYRFALLAAGSVTAVACTDLILPIVPFLPLELGGSIASAQFAMPAFLIGLVAGLILWGEAGARFGVGRTLIAAFSGFLVATLLCAAAPSTGALSFYRFLQGLCIAAPAVFSPGLIRAMYDQDRATKALGLLASLEAIAPICAPIVGVALFNVGGWQAPFWALAGLGVLLLIAFWLLRGEFRSNAVRESGSYASLIGNRPFLFYAFGHAASFGGLMVFVIGAPTVIVAVLNYGAALYIALQLAGALSFVIAANFAAFAARKFGEVFAIRLGSALAVLGTSVVLASALLEDGAFLVLAAGAVISAAGVGLRAPVGFLLALGVCADMVNRASAAVLVLTIGVTAAVSALLAPFIAFGIAPLALASGGLHLVGLGFGLAPNAKAKNPEALQ